MISNCFSYLLFLLLLLPLGGTMAQVNLQVNVMPPYQSNITDYASRPELILLTLTNTSANTQQIQLKGSISGSNGVAIMLKEGYRSTSPIVLGPMETKTLNGMDVVHLFEYNNLEVIGLTQRDFINGTGLPEGTYDFCIQAFDYNQPHVSLSPGEPVGCTILSITNLEPPTVISPFNDQELVNAGIQSFAITWSTPVGAPPHLQYNVRMVELLTDRDPTEAVWSANSFFEREVNQNTLLYGPAEPALTPGRRYALVVEARDPLQKTAIRNNGRSEVVVFTYGENLALAGLGDDEAVPVHQPRPGVDEVVPDKAFATHQVRGTLRWAFREQEHQYASQAKQQQGRTTAREMMANRTAPMGAALAIPANTSLHVAAANFNGSLVNPAAALKADPTVGTSFGMAVFQPAVAASQSTDGLTSQPMAPTMAPSALSVSGTSGVGLNRVQSPARPAAATYPLVGGTVSIQARMKSGPRGMSVHVGTVKTDNEGSFVLEIADPRNIIGIKNMSLVMIVNMPDFQRFEYDIGWLDPEGTDIDAGQHTLIANTFRFAPTFTVDAGEGGGSFESELEVMIYREASDIDNHPHLRREGLLSDQERVVKTIQGKEMVAVGKGRTSISGGLQAEFGTLFYSTNLWVEVVPEIEALQRRNIRLAVTENQVAKDEVLVVQPNYKLSLAAPAVSGRVVVKAGQTVQGIGGAYVQVGYKKEDLANPGLTVMPLITPAVATVRAPVGTGAGAAAPAPTATQPPATSVQAMGFDLPVGNGALAAGPALVNAQGEMNLLPAVPILNASDLTYDINAPYTVQTDSAGDYYVGNLPILKPGASYTVRLVRVPTGYENMAVEPQAREFTISPKPGSKNYQEFVVSPDLVTVSGRVIDNEQKPVRNARLNIKGSASFVETQDDGTFSMPYFAGDHVLEIRKQGYVALDKAVKIAKNPKQQLGDIGPVVRQSGNVRFVVHDEADPAKLLANVAIAAYDTTHQTNRSGDWLLEGIGGPTVVTVTPAASSGYVAAQYSIDIPVDGRVTEVSIPLATGVKVHGKVTSNSAAVGSAVVEVEGKPYLKATTDDAGQYSLYVPLGEETLRAGKSGYLAAAENSVLQGAEVEINFVLKDGGGKDISTLLGFEIQLESAVPDADVEGGEIWKGKFVNLKANASLFEGTAVAELPFDKVKVTFDASGKAIPGGNQVVTTTKALPIKLFDYLPLRLEGDEFITVRLNPERKGSIGGKLRVDGQAFQRRTLGIRYGNLGKTYLTPHVESGIVDVEVFHADGHDGVPEFTLQLSRLAQETTSVELYGFNVELDLTQSKVSQHGLTLAGNLKTPKLGIVDTMQITVKELTISRSFGIESALIDETTLPTLRIGEWAAHLGTVQLDEDGFKFGGEVDIDFPYSHKVKMAFEDLRMAKDAIYGGTFHLPDVGMKVYHLIALKTGRNPLSFNRIGETDVYSLGGSAIMQLPKLISKTFEVNTMQVQTDGKFFIDIPADVKADLGFASLTVNGVDVSNPDNGAPFVSLRGEFKTEIPGFKFEVGTIRFTADSHGEVSYAVEQLRASLDVPIMKVDLGLELVDNAEKSGFEGKGAFAIPESPVAADIDFHYHRLKTGGIELGGNFVAGAVIPIGAITIDKLGGGFSYASNTKAFAANIKGAISVTGLSSAAKLDNIDLNVNKDPLGVVIEGSVDLVVANTVQLSKAHVMLNTPAKKMTVAVDAKFEPLPKLAALQLNGDFAVSWDPNDTYAFFGAQANAALLGMKTATVDYVMAFNVKNPKTNADASISKYFTNMDAEYNASVFSGLYLYGNLKAEKRIDWKFDEWWCPTVTVKAYYDARLQTTFISNFVSNQYYLRLKGKAAFGGSAGLTFFGNYVGVGGDALFCFDVSGGYNNRWHFDGKMGGKLELFAGNKDVACNDYRIWGGVGARVCVDVYAHLKYDNGLSLGGGLGSFKDNNTWCD